MELFGRPKSLRAPLLILISKKDGPFESRNYLIASKTCDFSDTLAALLYPAASAILQKSIYNPTDFIYICINLNY